MTLYNASYPVDSAVRIADRAVLENFATSWRLHNPLETIQLDFAGRATTVKSIGYYHGGDVLYVLHDAPGVWHEQCLQSTEKNKT
jgi:hypothetical protein